MNINIPMVTLRPLQAECMLFVHYSLIELSCSVSWGTQG